MTTAKTFLYALEIICKDHKKAKSYLNDKRLTVSEKKVIESFFLIKKGDNQQAINFLKEIKSNDPVVDSQINLFLGIAYNNSGQFNFAEDKLKCAYAYLEDTSYSQLKFICLNSLFLLYFNQQSLSLMKVTLDEMKKNICNDESQLSYYRAQFNYYSRSGDIKKASSVLAKINESKNQMSEPQSISFLIDRFMFMIKLDQFDQAQLILEELKFKRSFNSTANFNFMKILLNNLVNDQPIYLNKSDYEESEFLYQQLLVVKSLEESNFSEAQKSWEWLMQHGPHIYLSDFNYKGDKCLFSLCLDKFKSRLSQVKIENHFKPNFSLEDKLIALLDNTSIPLSKDYIYKALWGREAQEKGDYNKLSQLISAVKIKNHLEIKFKKGCYQLIKDSKKVA